MIAKQLFVAAAASVLAAAVVCSAVLGGESATKRSPAKTAPSKAAPAPAASAAPCPVTVPALTEGSEGMTFGYVLAASATALELKPLTCLPVPAAGGKAVFPLARDDKGQVPELLAKSVASLKTNDSVRVEWKFQKGALTATRVGVVTIQTRSPQNGVVAIHSSALPKKP